MSTMFSKVDKARLSYAIDHGPPHMRPIMTVVRDCGVVLGLVSQGRERFELPQRDRPAILLIGDDVHVAVGPSGFHRKSIKLFAKRCHSAVIVSCAPLVEAYATAALECAALQHDVILVETRIEHETAWKEFIEAARPGIGFLIATLKPEGGVH